jgi:cystathionine beta-lyase/cystathionine gamma-synthase
MDHDAEDKLDVRTVWISDLHLGKSERLARRGGVLLPPYETRETLTRLDAALGATGARQVPIYATSAYMFESAEDAADKFALKKFGNIYSRLTNPTNSVLEARLAKHA